MCSRRRCARVVEIQKVDAIRLYRREALWKMLMPIAGKKPAKEAAVKKPAVGARRKSA
ncbi:hypothetical protein ABIB94_008786 [Bradyrhizobium sp. JR7.2]|uniref:hypothetical protein n=1 Tax=Bradyrhizobium TaxID=374 RepID=UPI0024AE94CC|nr:hypothetical protein [Bradyrhizobium barranii]WFT93452.1 hypothetical protein QA633_34905 [Bradyrhizobium barranii]